MDLLEPNLRPLILVAGPKHLAEELPPLFLVRMPIAYTCDIVVEEKFAA